MLEIFSEFYNSVLVDFTDSKKTRLLGVFVSSPRYCCRLVGSN